MTKLDAAQLKVQLLKFYTPEEAFEWLFAPHPQLGNEPAIDAIKHGHMDLVGEILERLDSDGYL